MRGAVLPIGGTAPRERRVIETACTDPEWSLHKLKRIAVC
jgi:hypothetical protein